MSGRGPVATTARVWGVHRRGPQRAVKRWEALSRGPRTAGDTLPSRAHTARSHPAEQSKLMLCVWGKVGGESPKGDASARGGCDPYPCMVGWLVWEHSTGGGYPYLDGVRGLDVQRDGLPGKGLPFAPRKQHTHHSVSAQRGARAAGSAVRGEAAERRRHTAPRLRHHSFPALTQGLHPPPATPQHTSP
jgi:hypothetical protein